jgi:hypothetical protein
LFDLESPPPGAMSMGPPSIESRARIVLGEAGIDPHQGEPPDTPPPEVPDHGARPWDLADDDVIDTEDDELQEVEGEGGSESRTDADASREPHAPDCSEPEGPQRIDSKLDRELRRDHGSHDFPF